VVTIGKHPITLYEIVTAGGYHEVAKSTGASGGAALRFIW